MFRKFLFIVACSLSLATVGHAKNAEPKQSIGIVNFASCVTDSKMGKQEQASFDSMKNQMTKSLEELEKQITEISAKFNDQEYLESLNPKAEEELKTKFRSLNEELARNQNQFYQLLNQANMRIIQMIQEQINQAAETIAKDKTLAMVVNKEAVFFYSPTLDVTTDVITEMDRLFEINEAKKAEAKKVETEKSDAAKTEKVAN